MTLLRLFPTKKSGDRRVNRKSKDTSIIRSSAAEYLTYVAATGGSDESIELRYEDENIWLTQKMMATLYGVEINTINEHIKKIYSDAELQEDATIRKFRIVQTEGNRQVSRDVIHYNLQIIIAVGFKVNNERAVQFRKWANTIVKDFTIKGWVMDDERLKNGGSKLTKEYFDKLLEKVREIRLSGRRFYQKVTDIYATAVDYDPSAKATHRFFAAVQNKLHYSVHGQLPLKSSTTAQMLKRNIWDSQTGMALRMVRSTAMMSSLQRTIFQKMNLESLNALFLHILISLRTWQSVIFR